MRLNRIAPLAAALLAACNYAPGGGQAQGNAQPGPAGGTVASAQPAGPGQAAGNQGPGDGMGSEVASAAPEDKQRPQMALQVALDRLGFSPGVIDGKQGMSTDQAIKAFQEANNLEPTGKLDDATRQALGERLNLPATRVVRLPADYVNASYQPLPDGPEKQAQLDQLGYTSIWERIGERFHTTAAVIRQLNPQLAAGSGSSGKSGGSGQPQAPQLAAGTQLRVPNVGADRIDPARAGDGQWMKTLVQLGVGTDQPKVQKIVVTKSTNELKAYDEQGKLVFASMVTSGSSHDPLPLGEWKVRGIATNPPFHYNPDLFWDASSSDSKMTLPPGPNGPVGVVWIDLSKEHYGIHGTSAPESIGRAQSHGCVRLTNWDAARLAEMVTPGVQVLFQA